MSSLSLGTSGFYDGPLTSSTRGIFFSPNALAFDVYHNALFVGDSYRRNVNIGSNAKPVIVLKYFYTVRRVSLMESNISTIAGTKWSSSASSKCFRIFESNRKF